MSLSPQVPYRPTKGLVAFFARTGTTISNPRAPHIQTRALAAFSYVEIAKKGMENGNQQRGDANHRGGSAGRGTGQGGLVGRGGFQPLNQGFHPGRGGRGTYTGRGGGRYDDRRGRGGSRGRNQQRGGNGRRGRGYHGGDRGDVDMLRLLILGLGHLHLVAALLQQAFTAGHAATRMNYPAGVASGDVALNLPAHAAPLLQQAFLALQGMDTAPLSQVPNPPKKDGTETTKLVPIKSLSKASANNEAPESSEQAANKDSSGKPPYCYRCFVKGHTIKECHKGMAAQSSVPIMPSECRGCKPFANGM
ncbi:hypothetical protein EJB05_51996, partial [Eragrostis curvula]